MTDHDRLAQRYGAPSPRRRRVLVACSALLATGFLAWLAWTALAHSNPEVSSDLVTWSVDGEHRVSAQVDVRLGDDDVVATCVLRATAEDHTVVGELSFRVGEAELGGGTTLEREVRTERRATSVDLVGCTTPEQARPR